jgi:signal transduction histidine kinase
VPKALVMDSVPAMVTLRVRLAAAVGAGVLFTTLVALSATLSPAARNPALHAAFEAAATVIAALAALLVRGRFTRSSERGDLLLMTGLAVFAAANLAFGAVPAIVSRVEPEPLAWVGVVARGLGVGLMTAAALVPARELRHPQRAARRWLGGCALFLGWLAAMAAVGAGALPAPVTPGSSPGDAFAGHPVIAASEAAMTALFGAAAIGFARRAVRDRDQLLAWFAIGSVFAAFARLNYLIYPSVLTEWFAAGDILRIAFFLCLLAGGAAEIRRAQDALRAAAVTEERRRIARDVHDGTAQDLAFILQVGRGLAERSGSDAALEHIVRAAQHALENTRHAIANLARPDDEPLIVALERTVHEVAGREGVDADVEGAVAVSVPPATRDALCLLAREAVTNAIRHGGARRVRLRIDDADKLTLRIEDDGRGFDPARARDSVGHFGLAGMDERVADLGGELRINSRPGRGTEVLVVLP